MEYLARISRRIARGIRRSYGDTNATHDVVGTIIPEEADGMSGGRCQGLRQAAASRR